ncbi:uncharacterized protein LOC118194939 [Stegodyphus dumicola]|uniref:uncharacterized protein LOC118194939 n=1 Tax=Stegodyphus dumicola TaxID=202533 RepID=UPI0015B0B142|nr:uncharacterized protein LOC118194939 [Stegodyphus dumicola]
MNCEIIEECDSERYANEIYKLNVHSLVSVEVLNCMMIAGLIVSCIIFAAAVHATSDLYGTSVVNTGISSSSRYQDKLGNYAFSYKILDAKGASNSRSEVGDAHGNKKGSYTLHDIDGRARRVDYIADGHGFRAVVKTNEPGTAFSKPASVLIDSPYAPPTAPSSVSTITKARLDPGVVAHPVAPVIVADSGVSHHPVTHYTPENRVFLSGYDSLVSPWINLGSSTYDSAVLPHHEFGFQTLGYGNGAMIQPNVIHNNLAYAYERARHSGLGINNLVSGEGILKFSGLGARNLAYLNGYFRNKQLGIDTLSNSYRNSGRGVTASIY